MKAARRVNVESRAQQTHLVSLTSPVDWTSLKPIKPGFYHWKKGNRSVKVLIARVEQMSADILFVDIKGTQLAGDLAEFPDHFCWSKEPFKGLE